MSKFKEHLKKHKTVYISAGCVVLGAGLAILTTTLVKNVRVGNLDTASVGNLDTGQSSLFLNQNNNRDVINNIHYIKHHRQGSPSWVIRDLTTGDIYPSQRAAAETLGLRQSEISKHLNGKIPEVNSHIFERICLAA